MKERRRETKIDCDEKRDGEGGWAEWESEGSW